MFRKSLTYGKKNYWFMLIFQIVLAYKIRAVVKLLFKSFPLTSENPNRGSHIAGYLIDANLGLLNVLCLRSSRVIMTAFSGGIYYIIAEIVLRRPNSEWVWPVRVILIIFYPKRMTTHLFMGYKYNYYTLQVCKLNLPIKTKRWNYSHVLTEAFTFTKTYTGFVQFRFSQSTRTSIKWESSDLLVWRPWTFILYYYIIILI